VAWATRMRLMAARGLAPRSERGPLAGAAGDGEDVGVELGLDADGADFGAGGGEQACGDGRDGGVEQACAGAGVVALEDLHFFCSEG
jgi:hypothetical protein